MKMNIYLHELKIRLKSVLIWSASIVAMLFVFLSLWPGFAEESDLLTSMMGNFPKELLMAFGMESMDWFSILGYFALVFLFVQICLAIQAANYGIGLVSIEETEWTADFLLAKPVGRTKIMTAKLLAALTALTITNAVVWIFSFVTLNMYAGGEQYDTGALISLLLSVAVFQLVFLSVGMVISLLVKRVRSVIPFSMGLVFGLYCFNAFGNMLGKKSLEVISPFKHFDPNYIIRNAAWDMPLVWISIVAIVISLAGSYLLYSRRNIPSAA
jgi:ABC-2 type transport system permease protein